MPEHRLTRLLLPHLKGPTAPPAAREEEIAPAEVLDEFIKEHKTPQGQGRLRRAASSTTRTEVKRSRSCPRREVLLGQLLRVLRAPLTQFVMRAQCAPLRDLAQRVLEQVVPKHEGGLKPRLRSGATRSRHIRESRED